ncbi:hypothetical protein BDR26DRAFT_850913, partial [Obelidium mucronatum]
MDSSVSPSPSSANQFTNQASLPCDECKTLRKKCCKSFPSCSRCLRRNVLCIYRTSALAEIALSANNSAALSLLDNSMATESTQSIQMRQMAERLAAAEAALSAAQKEISELKAPAPTHSPSPAIELTTTSALTIEDPDCMPSIGDWVLVHGYLTRKLFHIPILDSRRFINNFFNEPPALRLIMCSIAAHNHSPKLPHSIVMNYYQRARRVINRTELKTSLPNLQALFLHSEFLLGEFVINCFNP